MKNIVSNFLCLLLATSPLFAEEYFFFASFDNLYENPENWFPAYPGVEVKPGDKVIIYGDAYVAGYDLKVAGTLEVKLDAKLVSVSNNMHIKGGKVYNSGKILFNNIDNQGELINSVSAELSVNELKTQPGSLTNNSHSAQFTISGNLVNEGRFDNYSHCFVAGKFANLSVFNQIHASQLNVGGEMMLAPGSAFYHSRNSKLFFGSSLGTASNQNILN